MLEAKYYKDYRHNYLILKGVDFSPNMYQCKMVTGNKIAGLLPCLEKHINGETLLYYEITSKQTMESVYENSRISMKQLRKLFIHLKMAWEEMSRYLLDESGLVLRPEHIYVDVETEDILFLYYPFTTEEKYITTLLEFLIDRVDSEDRQAVEVTYKMYELVEKEQFVLDEVLQWFEQDYEETEERQHNTEEVGNQEEAWSPPVSDYERPRPVLKKGKASPVILFIGILIAAALLYLFFNYELGQKETVYFYAAFTADIIVVLVSICQFVYEKFRKLRPWDKEHRGMQTETVLYHNTEVYERVQDKADVSYGNTVFIPWAESCENKLYGMGKGNKNHIDLKHLPLTVGKLAGSVDMVIADQSISRRHVKFAREGGNIYMTDLNSTNGTFKNGFRLEPNTSELLEPGDEIRLGKLKFIYR